MTDTTDLSARLGAALGDGYAVERPLGEGGFAVVFLVRDLALKRSLAVKVLAPDVVTSKSTLERFRREAETVAQLSHPNIVPLHFIGQQDDLLYIAMQCVDGGSIGDRLETEKALPVEDVVRIIGEVASALAHAHKRGVIHRDIKPATSSPTARQPSSSGVRQSKPSTSPPACRISGSSVAVPVPK